GTVSWTIAVAAAIASGVAYACSDRIAVILTAHERLDAVAATSRGVASAERARANPSAEVTEIQESFDSRPRRSAARAAESGYVASARMASVRTRRSASRVAARRRAFALSPSDAESAWAFVRARTAQDRTWPDGSLLSASNVGNEAGSRGRNKAQVAR